MEKKLNLNDILDMTRVARILSEYYSSPQDTRFRQALTDLGYKYYSGNSLMEDDAIDVQPNRHLYYYINTEIKRVTYNTIDDKTACYNLNNINLGEKPKKLSKGDEVYFARNIKHDKSGAYSFAVGKIGTIMEISDFEGDKTYHVRIDGHNNPCSSSGLYRLKECELELVHDVYTLKDMYTLKEKNIGSGIDHNEGETMNNFDFYEVDQMVNKFYDRRLNDVDVHFENRCNRIIMDTELYASVVSAIKYLTPIPGYDLHTEAMAHIKSFANLRDRLPAKVLKEFNKASETQMNERESINNEKTKVHTLLHLCQTYEQITALLTEYHII